MQMSQCFNSATYPSGRRYEPDDEEGLEKVVSREPRDEYVGNEGCSIEKSKYNPVHHPFYLWKRMLYKIYLIKIARLFI